MAKRGKQSAGLLLYRRTGSELEVFLVHPGGPYWRNKDAGAWSIPKGEYPDGEEPLAAAQREFFEETGFPMAGPFAELGSVRLASGKVVSAWAVEGDLDAAAVRSNEFTMEWPPKSGKVQSFPEVDGAGWFTIAQAEVKMNPAQCEFLSRLRNVVA